MLSRQLLRQVCVCPYLSPGISLARVSSLDASSVSRESYLIAGGATLAGVAVSIPRACPFFSLLTIPSATSPTCCQAVPVTLLCLMLLMLEGMSDGHFKKRKKETGGAS